LNILLAEDDRCFGAVMKNELEEEDLHVDVVSDGVEAVLNFINNHYDAVLLDVSMPKLDGISTLKIIESLSPSVPVIVFSGKMGRDELEEAAGSAVCFRKPFLVAEIKDCIKKKLKLAGAGQ
jgi:two-component system response regulator QseB